MAAMRAAPLKNAASVAVVDTAPAAAPDTAARAKAQEFAHRLVEFADLEACCKFFRAKAVDFDHPNATGWSILMSVCACGRADLVGLVADATTNVSCATVPNRTTVLHLAAMSKNPLVMEELTATPERQEKLQAIVDAPNINGDTPLMMACVAKNVSAVRVLLTTLNANVSYGNANGMNALMCAARLNDRVTPEARDELMAASDEIVRLLLLHLHVQVNAAEVTAGNTALHFAVLSQNAKAVKRLTESAVQVDITIKNKVGMTAIEVGKRAHVSTAIMDLLQRRFAEMNAEAAKRSLAVQKELIASSLASTEVEKKAESSKKKKKPKKKAPSNHHTKLTEATMHETKIDKEIALSLGEDEHEAPAAPTQPTADVVSIEAQDDEDVQSEWQPATKKKNRRKLSIPEDKSRTTTQPKSRQPQNKQASRKTVLTEPPAVLCVQPITTQMPHTSTQSMNATIQKQPEVSSSSESKRPEIDKVDKIAVVAEVENHVDVESSSLSSSDEQQGRSGSSSSMSYHKLNAIFHRTFPMADELDIAVESFVIASSATDAKLQPADGLSISQVEVLQEAHLRAYHYLNEKKMELTRVLEAQRLEAQFALQKEILHLN